MITLTMERKDTLALVHEFTRTHKTTVENDDGTKTYVDVYSHLDQLQDAINGASSGGGGSSSRDRAPVSLKAVDLWRSIVAVVNEYWPGRGRPHLARTPLHQRIQQWAAAAVNSNDHTDDEKLHDHLRHWISQIQGLFEPSVELAAPCPECGESFMWRHDGVENVKKRTLTYNQHRAWCNNCEQTWEGKASMANLARILHGNQPLNGTPAHTSETGV